MVACFLWGPERPSLARFAARALFRPCETRVRELRLDIPYYPVRAGEGYILMPKDAYFEAVEELLKL
ncbi:hypothetical protein DV704_04525 [Meiothermus sp. QL-1]|nr:hypothetical protein DV704_04525 [Meiothermus sp. QL-1]